MKRIVGLLLFTFLLSTAFAQVAPRPVPARLYNNLSKEFPDFLNQDEAAALEEKLEVFSNETSNQICVVIVDDLNDMDASSYAIQLGEEWGIGQKEKNNGIVILIKPTGSAGGRDLFIAVGYGLEGAIPDLATKKIREEEMQPFLKQGQFYSALDNGTTVLMKLAKGEINVKNYTRRSLGGGRNSALTIIIIIIFVIIFLRNMFGGGGGRTLSGLGRGMFWGSMMSGGWGGGRSSGGWGGSGGGGFGGFGGGSFGGGGSGGKW